VVWEAWVWVEAWVSNMLTVKKHWRTISMGIMIVLFFLMSFMYEGTLEERNKEITQTEQLMKAITDKMDSVVIENGKLMYSKKTLQASVKDLNSIKESLNDEQQNLMTKISKANKEKQVIAAALVKTKAELADIKGKTNFINDTTLALTMDSDSLSYIIEVTGVAIAKDSPQHIIKSLVIPNEMYIDFKWGAKKEGYPVSFSITNSSPYMNTYNIESYMIPEIIKDELRPTFLQKIGRFAVDNKTPFVIGFGAGAATILILTK
jgi:seryl-tRNA synthetase